MNLTPEQLAAMPWDQLLQLRRNAPPEQQAMLAPYEHRAYAREAVAENPLMALPMALMVPGYQLHKLLGAGARTRPSWEQLSQGLLGTGEGFTQGMRGLLGGGS